MWPFFGIGKQAGTSVSPPHERAFFRLLVSDLAWPASTFVQEGQVDFIRLADLTFVEPAKQEMPMAYVTSIDDPLTSFSLTTERFLCVSTRYLLASLQIGPVLVKESSDNYPVGEFVDPPAFRRPATRCDVRQQSQASHLHEVRL
jgi:hypothetical protein